jgi:hypothetical protein
MKTRFFILLIVFSMPLAVAAQDWELIPLETVKAIADRNAQALWGYVYSAEPIPYYGFDDEIVAWRFNYAIGKPFPKAEELISACRVYYEAGETYQQWGGDDFGEMMLGGRDNMPVIIEYSQSLSQEYALGFEIERLATEMSDSNPTVTGKIYYLDHFNTWHEHETGGERFFVCASPTGGVLGEMDFLTKKNSEEPFIKPKNYKEQWTDYREGKTQTRSGTVLIQNPELMPFYDWSYGCSPTAAAMLFAWYDNRSLITPHKYAYLVGHHFQRRDTLSNNNAHWDYNVSNLQKSLAIGMETDTLTGSTMPWNIDNGMKWAANTQRGYNFDVVNRYSSKWNRLKADINQGKPLLAHIYGHSVTCVGYNESDEAVLTHYTHSPPNHYKWINRDAILMLTRVTHGGSKGAAIKLLTPYGDRRYNRTGEGERYREGNYAEIRWEADPVPGSMVRLAYSTDGGYNFTDIATGLPNTGVYDWLVPYGVASNSCRVIARIYTPDMGGIIAGADGSWSNFRITTGSPLFTMSHLDINYNENATGYYLTYHGNPSWAAIGNQSEGPGGTWDIHLFPDDQFNQESLITSSVGHRPTNFIVMDGHNLPPQSRGIKFVSKHYTSSNEAQYEGNTQTLNMSPGDYVTIGWNNADRIIDMRDIYLTPGSYYFVLHHDLATVDVDMALFGSNDGVYIKTIDQAMYKSENWGSVSESFVANITEAGIYGLCLYAKTRGTGTLHLQMLEPYIWRGQVSSNWHHPGNWAANMVPGSTSKVTIPPNTFFSPVISADATAQTLDILPNATLTINSNNLFVLGDLFLNGHLNIAGASSWVTCQGNITFADQGNMTAPPLGGIRAQGNFTFTEGSQYQPTSGKIEFTGSSNSLIYIKSPNSWFYNLDVNKSGGAFVAYENTPGLQPLRIKNQFWIRNGKFYQYAMYNIILEGLFMAESGTQFAFANGTVIYNLSGAGGVNIQSQPGSYFNNLTIDSPGLWVGLWNDIDIRGDLDISNGTFRTYGHTVYLGGNFTQNAGFDHGSGKVVFNGFGTQSVNGVDFWRLELNKNSGELRFPVNQTNIQHYKWIKGTMRVNGGEVNILGLDDPGIYGTTIVTSGKLDIWQSVINYIDLNGHLNISGGEMNIYGGMEESWWPYSAPASITMSGGVLDFKDVGIRIVNSTHPFTANITGGTIRTSGGLRVLRSDFNPQGGTFEFYGNQSDEVLSVNEASSLFHLDINKGAGTKEKSERKKLTALGSLKLNGDFTLTDGIFAAPATMYLGGGFINLQLPENFEELNVSVIYFGNSACILYGDVTVNNFTVDKTVDAGVIVQSPNKLTVKNKLFVKKGFLQFEQGCQLFVGNEFETDAGAQVRFNGAGGSPILVSNYDSKSNYSFEIKGGSIEAVHTIFEKMDINGININAAAWIPADKAFHHCTFRDGAPGGTLLTWNKGFNRVVENAVFPANTTGSLYNVAKTTDFGNVYFDNVTGAFAGAPYENDLWGRVHWEYLPPLDLPFTEKWTSGDFATNHWTKTSDNWFITAINGNPPPAARFNYEPNITNYSADIRSHFLDATNYSTVFLSYDIAYEDYQYNTGTLEKFDVIVMLENENSWVAATYDNQAGSFDYISEELDISGVAAGNNIRIYFRAYGQDSWNIEAWFVDNISVYGVAIPPATLQGYVYDALTGNDIENAMVIVDGTSYSALSLSDGFYIIPGIPHGAYNVTASADGYFPKTFENIELTPDATFLLDFELNAVPPQYCTENLYVFGCAAGDGLIHFELRDIVNAESGCSDGGYGDFTFMSTELPRGYIYQVVMQSGYDNQYVSLWIDFDDDFYFDDPERLLTDFYMPNPAQQYTANIFVPEDAPIGAHRLRVRTNWNDPGADPCELLYYGEAEDYTVEIIDDLLTGALFVVITSATTGDPVGNACVELVGTEWMTFTNDEGIILFDWLTPGAYDIAVSAQDYEPLEISDFYILADQALELFVELESVPLTTQQLVIPEGWSGLSGYIMPIDNSIENIFSPVVDDLIILQNFSGIYWPDESINTIGMWAQHDAFSVKANSDLNLPITGFTVDNKVFELSDNWTMLPVLCNHSVNTEELFLPVQDDLLLAKEIAGNGVYWPAFSINTLLQLQPGKAYMVKMQSAASVTFPENMTKTETAVNLKEPISCELWDNPVPTANSHIIAIPVGVWASVGFSEGDFVGVFTPEGICAGLAQLSGNTSIAVFGDDPLVHSKQGFEVGEAMVFRIYKTATGDLFDLEVAFDPAFHSGNFDAMGISVVTGITNAAASVSGMEKAAPVVYPNPTTGIIQITGIHANAHITIYKSKGKKILEQENYQEKAVLNLSANPPGVYLLRITHAAGVFNRKIIVY